MNLWIYSLSICFRSFSVVWLSVKPISLCKLYPVSWSFEKFTISIPLVSVLLPSMNGSLDPFFWPSKLNFLPHHWSNFILKSKQETAALSCVTILFTEPTLFCLTVVINFLPTLPFFLSKSQDFISLDLKIFMCCLDSVIVLIFEVFYLYSYRKLVVHLYVHRLGYLIRVLKKKKS